MRRQLVSAVAMLFVLTVLLGFIYPLAVTGVAQIAFKDKANGSFIKVDGKTVGSKLIGQNFTADKYFQGRPSAAGKNGYDATASSATNLGPSNQKLLDAVSSAADAYRKSNGLPAGAKVPVDAVTSSGSGLDPEISVDNARIQAKRVAIARNLTVDRVNALIDKHTTNSTLGFLGDKGVNVLELNLALDSAH